MQRNEIIEIIKTLKEKKLISEINDLKKLLNNYDNKVKTNFTNEEKVNILWIILKVEIVYILTFLLIITDINVGEILYRNT